MSNHLKTRPVRVALIPHQQLRSCRPLPYQRRPERAKVDQPPTFDHMPIWPCMSVEHPVAVAVHNLGQLRLCARWQLGSDSELMRISYRVAVPPHPGSYAHVLCVEHHQIRRLEVVQRIWRGLYTQPTPAISSTERLSSGSLHHVANKFCEVLAAPLAFLVAPHQAASALLSASKKSGSNSARKATPCLPGRISQSSEMK